MAAALEEWITAITGCAVKELRRRPGGGRHQAWDVRCDGGDHFFLRADANPPTEREHYTLRREAEIYQALSSAGLPVPPILGVHPVHEAVLMGHAEGTAPIRDLTPEAQQEIIDDFVPIIARLHALDPRVPCLGRVGTLRQHVVQELDIWQARLPRREPFLTACFAWLREHLPAFDGRPSLVQGDTGPGNFLHDGHRVTAVLDFELAHLGDPMEDLAWIGTRNAQEPLPDYSRLLRQYEQLSGAPVDPVRLRYHMLFAELRIAVLYAERRAAGPQAGADLGNQLIYGTLHARLTVEALAAAAGIRLPEPALPAPAESSNTVYFDSVLSELREVIGPHIDDPFAVSRSKGVARVVKYLSEVDRFGGLHREAELADLAQLLGTQPPSVEAAWASVDERVHAGALDAVALLPCAWRQVMRQQQLVGPAMGVLATRHLPEVSA